MVDSNVQMFQTQQHYRFESKCGFMTSQSYNEVNTFFRTMELVFCER